MNNYGLEFPNTRLPTRILSRATEYPFGDYVSTVKYFLENNNNVSTVKDFLENSMSIVKDVMTFYILARITSLENFLIVKNYLM